MPRHAAEINEVAGLGRTESDSRAGALAGHPRRLRVLIWKHDIVLSPLAIDQCELDDLSFCSGQDRIHFLIDRAADADIDHATFSYPRPQRVPGVWDVSDGGCGCI